MSSTDAIESNDLATFCLPDFSKCGAAATDLLPHLFEGLEHFKSMQWLSTENTGSKQFLQSPVFDVTKNVNLTFGVCCLPFCGTATQARTFAKVLTDKSCETVCLSACLLNCCCCCGTCWMLKNRGDFRKKYDLAGSGLGDCLSLTCCGPCAVCQEANEVMTVPAASFFVPLCALPPSAVTVSNEAPKAAVKESEEKPKELPAEEEKPPVKVEEVKVMEEAKAAEGAVVADAK